MPIKDHAKVLRRSGQSPKLSVLEYENGTRIEEHKLTPTGLQFYQTMWVHSSGVPRYAREASVDIIEGIKNSKGKLLSIGPIIDTETGDGVLVFEGAPSYDDISQGRGTPYEAVSGRTSEVYNAVTRRILQLDETGDVVIIGNLRKQKSKPDESQDIIVYRSNIGPIDFSD